MVNFNEEILEATKAHARGHIEKHRINVLVLMNNSVGIGEHGNILEEIEKEVLEIAKYNDILEILEKHF